MVLRLYYYIVLLPFRIGSRKTSTATLTSPTTTISTKLRCRQHGIKFTDSWPPRRGGSVLRLENSAELHSTLFQNLVPATPVDRGWAGPTQSTMLPTSPSQDVGGRHMHCRYVARCGPFSRNEKKEA
ncbi:hypothetical protein QTP88_022930 [Uroleucon formosanum]